MKNKTELKIWEQQTDKDFEKTHRKNCVISYTKTTGSIPIAVDKKTGNIIFFNENAEFTHPLRDGDFIPIHSKDFVEFISARRGAGKSTYVNDLIKAMNDTIDEKLKFVFVSRLSSDESIKLPENSIRVKPAEIIPEEYDVGKDDYEDGDTIIEALKNSIIIFDDIHDSKLTENMRKRLQNFIIDLLENSRHYNIQIIMTSHMITNYRKTRDILNELSNIVVFPQFSNAHQIEWSLKEYFGIRKDLLKKIMNITNSRWVNISSIKPKVIISQKEIFNY